MYGEEDFSMPGTSTTSTSTTTIPTMMTSSTWLLYWLDGPVTLILSVSGALLNLLTIYVISQYTVPKRRRKLGIAIAARTEQRLLHQQRGENVSQATEADHHQQHCGSSGRLRGLLFSASARLKLRSAPASHADNKKISADQLVTPNFPAESPPTSGSNNNNHNSHNSCAPQGEGKIPQQTTTPQQQHEVRKPTAGSTQTTFVVTFTMVSSDSSEAESNASEEEMAEAPPLPAYVPPNPADVEAQISRRVGGGGGRRGQEPTQRLSSCPGRLLLGPFTPWVSINGGGGHYSPAINTLHKSTAAAIPSYRASLPTYYNTTNYYSGHLSQHHRRPAEEGDLIHDSEKNATGCGSVDDCVVADRMYRISSPPPRPLVPSPPPRSPSPAHTSMPQLPSSSSIAEAAAATALAEPPESTVGTPMGAANPLYPRIPTFMGSLASTSGFSSASSSPASPGRSRRSTVRGPKQRHNTHPQQNQHAAGGISTAGAVGSAQTSPRGSMPPYRRRGSYCRPPRVYSFLLWMAMSDTLLLASSQFMYAWPAVYPSSRVVLEVARVAYWVGNAAMMASVWLMLALTFDRYWALKRRPFIRMGGRRGKGHGKELVLGDHLHGMVAVLCLLAAAAALPRLFEYTLVCGGSNGSNTVYTATRRGTTSTMLEIIAMGGGGNEEELLCSLARTPLLVNAWYFAGYRLLGGLILYAFLPYALLFVFLRKIWSVLCMASQLGSARILLRPASVASNHSGLVTNNVAVTSYSISNGLNKKVGGVGSCGANGMIEPTYVGGGGGGGGSPCLSGTSLGGIASVKACRYGAIRRFVRQRLHSDETTDSEIILMLLNLKFLVSRLGPWLCDCAEFYHRYYYSSHQPSQSTGFIFESAKSGDGHSPNWLQLAASASNFVVVGSSAINFFIFYAFSSTFRRFLWAGCFLPRSEPKGP